MELEVAEFALRVPTVIGGDLSVETQHYSQVVKVPARSELFALVE